MADVKVETSAKSGKQNEPHYSGYASMKRAYGKGRNIGWNAYDSLDYRKLNRFLLVSGVSAGYKAHRKYDKKGKIPYWVNKD